MIYDEILKDSDFQKLYDKLILSYGLKTIDNNYIAEADVIDLIKYADLLSKSTGPNLEYNKTLAQDIVFGLTFLFPDNKKIKYFAASILSSVGNYIGRNKIDDNFTFENPLDNFMDKLSMEYLAVPNEEDTYFFSSQKLIYDKLDSNCFSYSGRTSLGKSFIIFSFIKDKILSNSNCNFVIVVPSKALINQNNLDLIAKLNNLLTEKNYRIIVSGNSVLLQNDKNFIFVFTPERLLYLLSQHPEIKIDYLFIDEAHKISEEDDRCIFYYTDIQLIRDLNPNCKIIFSSPNIPNPGKYTELDLSNNKPFNIRSQYSPVSQNKLILNFKTKDVKVYNSITKKFKTVSKNYLEGKTFYDILDDNKDKLNLIYCGGLEKTVDMAIEYSKNKLNLMIPELDTFSNQIKESVHSDFFLADLVKKGIAYHTGFLPTRIRYTLEKLYKEEKIKVLFCTSTLIEGVNMPADNLFVTTYKNGRDEFSLVDFNNLIGRVGRIKYNLYGNVFLTKLEGTKVSIEKFEEMVSSSIPEVQLTSNHGVIKGNLEAILTSLENGEYELSQALRENDNYPLLRKTAKHLFKNIIDNKYDKFTLDLLRTVDEARIQKIRSNFSQMKDYTDNDLNTSTDQNFTLTKAIQRGLKYPDKSVIETAFAYEAVLSFLNTLAKIFKWETYEPDTLGYKDSNGEFSKLKHYTSLLLDWIRGYGIMIITSKAIENTKNKGIIYYNREKHPYDVNNTNGLKKYQDNIIIERTLTDIEKIILFKLSNYFLKFSDIYKKHHNLDVIDDDWYEFIEYGTTNEKNIFLQRCGFSRETAEFIKSQGNKYIEKINNEFKIHRTLENTNKENVKIEFLDLKNNLSDIIIE